MVVDGKAFRSDRVDLTVVALGEAMPLSRFGQFSFWRSLFMCTMENGEK